MVFEEFGEDILIDNRELVMKSDIHLLRELLIVVIT